MEGALSSQGRSNSGHGYIRSGTRQELIILLLLLFLDMSAIWESAVSVASHGPLGPLLATLCLTPQVPRLGAGIHPSYHILARRVSS